ncbi:MAG TPA: hypothetical protein VJ767_08860 [Nitrososphaeraceae archaeon]|nr:hypothetical protein [Nitrososphaeraceae archaeon]
MKSIYVFSQSEFIISSLELKSNTISIPSLQSKKYLPEPPLNMSFPEPPNKKTGFVFVFCNTLEESCTLLKSFNDGNEI